MPSFKLRNQAEPEAYQLLALYTSVIHLETNVVARPSTTLCFRANIPLLGRVAPFSTAIDVPQRLARLNLLSTPSVIGVPHVRRWLDGRHEFQRDISNTNNTNKRSGYSHVPGATDNDTADENVDYSMHKEVSVGLFPYLKKTTIAKLIASRSIA